MLFRAVLLPAAIACTIVACRTDPALPAPDPDAVLRLDQIQVMASHNSYKQPMPDTVASFLVSISAQLPPDLDPTELDYAHPPFLEQLNVHLLHGLEIDVYNDPDGGAFATRRVNSFVGLPEASGLPELDAPGMKVLHIKDVDYNTHALTFRAALQVLKGWSAQHPRHLPLFVNVEAKQDSPGDNALLAALGFQPAPPFDAAAADALDDELRSVFGPGLDGILTPDRLRGGRSDLHEVVSGRHWPLLKDCRGQILFILEGAATTDYVSGHPALTGRAMFVYGDPGQAETAFVLRNDPVGHMDEIAALVQQGYVVRTRCDEGTREVRNGDVSRRDAAFASGAQILSTDYYRPDPRAGQSGWTDYTALLPGRITVRANPVNTGSLPSLGPIAP